MKDVRDRIFCVQILLSQILNKIDEFKKKFLNLNSYKNLLNSYQIIYIFNFNRKKMNQQFVDLAL